MLYWGIVLFICIVVFVVSLKAPEDGLSGKTDEDNLGFTYDELDNFLLQGHYPSYDVYKNIEERHKRNLHKVKPMPSCPRYYSTRDWEV